MTQHYWPYSLHVDKEVNGIIADIQSWACGENEVLLDALVFAKRAGFFREAKKKHKDAEKARRAAEKARTKASR